MLPPAAAPDRESQDKFRPALGAARDRRWCLRAPAGFPVLWPAPCRCRERAAPHSDRDRTCRIPAPALRRESGSPQLCTPISTTPPTAFALIPTGDRRAEYLTALSSSCRRATCISCRSISTGGRPGAIERSTARPSRPSDIWSSAPPIRPETECARLLRSTLPASMRARCVVSVTSLFSLSASWSTTVRSSSRCFSFMLPPERRAVVAPLMDVSGVLNSCASASSSVDLNSSLCRTAAALVAIWWLRAFSSVIAIRFSSAWTAGSGEVLPARRTLPMHFPPGHERTDHAFALGLIQRSTVPGSHFQPEFQIRHGALPGRVHRAPRGIEDCDAPGGVDPQHLVGDLRGNRRIRLDQHDGAAEFVEPFHLEPPAGRLRRPMPGSSRKLTRNQRRRQEGEKRHPVVRVADFPCPDRREEEVIEAERSRNRRRNGFVESTVRRSDEHLDQIRKTCRARVDGNGEGEDCSRTHYTAQRGHSNKHRPREVRVACPSRHLVRPLRLRGIKPEARWRGTAAQPIQYT